MKVPTLLRSATPPFVKTSPIAIALPALSVKLLAKVVTACAVGVTTPQAIKPSTAGKAPVSPLASPISWATNMTTPTEIQEIVQNEIAANTVLIGAKTIIGLKIPPNPWAFP